MTNNFTMLNEMYNPTPNSSFDSTTSASNMSEIVEMVDEDNNQFDPVEEAQRHGHNNTTKIYHISNPFHLHSHRKITHKECAADFCDF